MAKHLLNDKGFTLIELMIVMAIVALLMGMVGPLAINSLEKAEAKQEMLSLKNWLSKVSYKAYATGQAQQITLVGKNITLSGLSAINNKQVVETFESLFFQPQVISFNKKGMVSPNIINGEYKGEPLSLNLKQWVNGEESVALRQLPNSI